MEKLHEPHNVYSTGINRRIKMWRINGRHIQRRAQNSYRSLIEHAQGKRLPKIPSCGQCIKGWFTHSAPRPYRSPAMPCR